MRNQGLSVQLEPCDALECDCARNAFCGMKDLMRPWVVTQASETEADTDTATITRLDRPWNVVVLDDPVSLMTYVTKVFMEVFGYPEPKAQRLMLEVHNMGRSIVWTGSREQAEVYATKLLAYHLLSKLERVDS